MEIIYCQKCHTIKNTPISYENARKEIEEICNFKVQNLCACYCGPGESVHFVVIDDEIIEAASYPDLLKKIKERFHDN